jgi:two-component system copper resistance phosphate regulon response regulator CusR
MSKPFAFGELLARIRLRLRPAPSAEVHPVGELTAGGVTLDLRSRRVSAQGRASDLSAREFVLLETFLRHPGQVLSREQLLSHVWGFDFDPGSMSSMCMCATCAARSVPTPSRRSGEPATASAPEDRTRCPP